MAITTNQIKNGFCFEMDRQIYTVLSFQHIKPGKGAAFVRTKIKNLVSGKIIDKTFNAGIKIQPARILRKPYQYLYQENDYYYFMDTISFEQMSVEKKKISNPQLLKSGTTVEMLIHQERDTLLQCELPYFVHLKVTYTEPGVKGDTATKAMKWATVETGASIQVPLFIEKDEVIKIDTKNQIYIERIKK